MVRDSYNISVIMPFKDKAHMTLTAVKSLLRFGPLVKEILLVSNNSSESELMHIREGIADIKHAKLFEYNRPFNYQKINNWAVKQISGEYILFLNNDTELNRHSRGTLEYMCKLASKKDVGMVGCVLLYGDEMTIQHAGVYLRPGSLGDHIYVGNRGSCLNSSHRCSPINRKEEV
jgi:glycosyltransferase involved in cell wall biosynthesis